MGFLYLGAVIAVVFTIIKVLDAISRADARKIEAENMFNKTKLSEAQLDLYKSKKEMSSIIYGAMLVGVILIVVIFINSISINNVPKESSLEDSVAVHKIE